MTFVTMVGRFQYIFCPTNTACPISWINTKTNVQKLQQYACQNLHQLYGKLISKYIHNIILPELVFEAFSITPNDESYDERLKQLLSTHGLKCICFSTVYN